MKTSIFAFLVGVMLLIFLPKDNNSHLLGLLAALLCVGGATTFIMLLCTRKPLPKDDKWDNKEE